MPKYTNTKSGESREMSDTTYKALSPGMKALWKLDSDITAAVASTAKSIPPAGITVNASGKNADEAHDVLAEVFDELGIAKPDGSILDMAITAAGALRQGKAAIDSALKTANDALGIKDGETEKTPDLTAKGAEKTEEVKPKTFAEMNAKELKVELDKRGVPYKGNASTAQLLEQLQNAD